MDAVREALVWALRGTVSHRLMEVARGAASAGEEAQDALYAVTGQMIGSRAYRGAAHPALVRAALLADEDPPEGPELGGMVHLVAAIGLGAQEVGADALAEAFGTWGMFGLSVEDWVRMLGAAERGEGPPVDWGCSSSTRTCWGRFSGPGVRSWCMRERCCSACGCSTGCT